MTIDLSTARLVVKNNFPVREKIGDIWYYFHWNCTGSAFSARAIVPRSRIRKWRSEYYPVHSNKIVSLRKEIASADR